MLCRSCRRRFPRGAPACTSCGVSRDGATETLDLVLVDGTRVPVSDEVTIGRAPGSTLQLGDPSVSRQHARISPGRRAGDPPVLVDVGSSYGTWVDGQRVDGDPVPLRDGSRVRLGDQELLVERRRAAWEARRTIVVPKGASLVLPRPSTTQFGPSPRLRSGYALKRLGASEGPRRWVLRDLVGDDFVRLDDDDAKLLQLLDGARPLSDLVREAEQQLGASGPARLARLLADLGERGLLAASDEPTGMAAAKPRALERLLQPRERVWLGAGEWFQRLYARGGWLLFTGPALAAIALVAAIGIGAFAYLVVARYGTPFVVANKIGLGGIVFLLGRAGLVAAHETAHGLTMASFGRRAGKAGLKVLLVFPYAFVDTSEAWFEPRRRRIAVSAAGPVSDLTLGGAFALACLALPAGSVRDVCFQLAFAAYLGALFNLNPLLQRDGYQILSDLLREPGLRRRALQQLRQRLSGRPTSRSGVLGIYATFALAWMVVAAVFAAGMSLRYATALSALVPPVVVWLLLAGLWTALFTPVAALVLPALRERRRPAGA
jgi:putative peptide zinc metalloprotease protein